MRRRAVDAAGGGGRHARGGAARQDAMTYLEQPQSVHERDILLQSLGSELKLAMGERRTEEDLGKARLS
jgi:hypothetical protein